MAEIQLKYTKRDKDRHGNVRWYYVETGKPKVRLNSEGVDIGSPAFFARSLPISRSTSDNPYS